MLKYKVNKQLSFIQVKKKYHKMWFFLVVLPFLAALAAAISDDVDGAFVIEAKASNWAVVCVRKTVVERAWKKENSFENTSGPENQKSPGQKNSWNQINQFQEIFFNSNIFHKD